MSALGVVHWEEDPTRTRVITGSCRRCQKARAAGNYTRLVSFEDPVIVSPAGIAHEGGEREGTTLCGIDATGLDWWWRA